MKSRIEKTNNPILIGKSSSSSFFNEAGGRQSFIKKSENKKYFFSPIQIQTKQQDSESFETKPSEQTYKMKKGDSFWKLEKQWGINHGILLELNPEWQGYDEDGVKKTHKMPIGTIIKIKPIKHIKNENESEWEKLSKMTDEEFQNYMQSKRLATGWAGSGDGFWLTLFSGGPGGFSFKWLLNSRKISLSLIREQVEKIAVKKASQRIPSLMIYLGKKLKEFDAKLEGHENPY